MTRVQRYLQNNGHLYRTQSTVYLKKKKKLQCSGVLDYQHCIKEKTKTSGSRRTDTYIYRKQTKLFVAVLFMWSLHCASLYHVLIKKKKKKNTQKTLINCLPNECTAKKKNLCTFGRETQHFFLFFKCSLPFSNYLRV